MNVLIYRKYLGHHVNKSPHAYNLHRTQHAVTSVLFFSCSSSFSYLTREQHVWIIQLWYWSPERPRNTWVQRSGTAGWTGWTRTLRPASSTPAVKPWAVGEFEPHFPDLFLRPLLWFMKHRREDLGILLVFFRAWAKFLGFRFLVF